MDGRIFAGVVAFADEDGADLSEDAPFGAILRADLAFRTARARARSGAAPKTEEEADAFPDAVSAAVPAATVPTDRFAAAEAAWAALLSGSGGGRKYGLPSLSDVRVAPLLSTRWGQSGGAANYYTPNNYVCGCVALAGAQIARYWQFPKTSRPSVSRTCWVDGFEQTFSTKGGTYAWSSMPPIFASLADAQKTAIGKLCYDFGVATYMDWTYYGSGTGGFCLDEAFRDVFGYANSRTYVGERNAAVPDAIVEKTVFANLDARCPVSLGIDGHMVDADGYGFAGGVPYTHLNMGWEGSGDAWYNLPDVDCSNGYESTILDEIVYNVFPEKTGDLLTGRVLDSGGVPVVGAAVRAVSGGDSAAATTDAKGIFALWVGGGRAWDLSASAAGGTASTNVFVPESVSTEVIADDHTPGTGSPGNLWGAELALAVSVTVPPAAPTGVSASQGTRADRIRLSWNAVAGATSYAVFRAESEEGDRVRVATCSGTSWDDTSAGRGTNYWYWVAGANLGGTGAHGGPAEGWRAADANAGTFADGLDATQLSWTTSAGAPWTFAEDVSLDDEDSARSGNVWTNNAPTLTWIETQVDGPAQVSFVYRKNFASGCFRTEIDGEEKLSDGNPAVNVKTWHSAVFELGSGTHVVRLSYEHGGGSVGSHNGVWVDEFDVAPPGGFPPNAPTVLGASQNAADAVTVYWKSSKLAASYDVFRADREDVGVAVPVGTAAASDSEHVMFADTTATPGTTNWYWVAAVNGAGRSAYGGPAVGWRKAVEPEDPETRTTPVPVPHAWLDGFPGPLAAHGWDYEAFANSTASNGVDAVWQCYVTGVSPTNAAERFLATISFPGGEPEVKWTPDLGDARDYAVEGRATFADDWGDADASSRFFRVRVSLPE